MDRGVYFDAEERTQDALLKPQAIYCGIQARTPFLAATSSDRAFKHTLGTIWQDAGIRRSFMMADLIDALRANVPNPKLHQAIKELKDAIEEVQGNPEAIAKYLPRAECLPPTSQATRTRIAHAAPSTLP